MTIKVIVTDLKTKRQATSVWHNVQRLEEKNDHYEWWDIVCVRRGGKMGGGGGGGGGGGVVERQNAGGIALSRNSFLATFQKGQKTVSFVYF